MQDLVASVLDDEEAVEQLEDHRRHGEEVAGDEDLTVVLEKCKPPLGRIATAPNRSEISAHAPFGDEEAELQSSP